MTRLAAPTRPPLPHFSLETVSQKVCIAEDAWNCRRPVTVAQAHTPDSQRRNRAAFLAGCAAIEALLTARWERELECRLVKELWTFAASRIASINDLPIAREDQKFLWPLGRRPDGHTSLTQMGL